MGRVEASSANWEELKPWKRDSRGFQVVADPCSTIAHWQEHHTGQDICTIWAKNQKLLKRALLLMGEESRCQAEAQGRGGRGTSQGRGKGLESDSAHISHTPGEPHLAHLGNFARCQTNTSFVHISHVLHLVQVLTYIACSNKQNQNCQIFRANIK